MSTLCNLLFSGFDQPGCANRLSPGSCNHDRAPEYYAESISTKNDKRFWGFKCLFQLFHDLIPRNYFSLTLILFVGAHWYLYAIGMCREEESNSIAEMGYNVSTR